MAAPALCVVPPPGGARCLPDLPSCGRLRICLGTGIGKPNADSGPLRRLRLIATDETRPPTSGGETLRSQMVAPLPPRPRSTLPSARQVRQQRTLRPDTRSRIQPGGVFRPARRAHECTSEGRIRGMVCGRVDSKRRHCGWPVPGPAALGGAPARGPFTNRSSTTLVCELPDADLQVDHVVRRSSGTEVESM